MTRILAILLPVACEAVYHPKATSMAAEVQSKPSYFKSLGMAESSSYTAPFDFDGRPSWSWHHPKGRAYTMTYGVTIDDDLSIYLTSLDGVRKFSEAGQLLWEHITRPRLMYNTASLANGTVYGQDLDGHVFALSMATGQLIWETRVSDAMGQNNGFTNNDAGMLVVDSHATHGASNAVSGINATDGSVRWTFQTSAPVWNFGALFPGDGSVVFQDRTGVAYRLEAESGKLIWTSGKHDQPSFTDGTANIDSDGNVYTVENMGMDFSENSLGKLTKRALDDGRILWQVVTPHPPNNQPLIGHGLVIQAMGSQMQQAAYTHVFAYDQETGEVRWVFHGPAQKGKMQAGDEEFWGLREAAGLPGLCWPNPWSAPAFGHDGTVYIGNQEGGFYSLRDTSGDGVIAGPEEVSVYETLAAFPGSSSPAIAPGMVAVASCDTLFVFKG